MAENRKIVFTADLNATDVTQELAKVDKAAKTTSTNMSNDFGMVQDQLDFLPGSLGQVAGGIKGFIGGLKALKTAWMATGIGALVVGLAAVATYFTKTQRGAEMLEKASLALELTFGVVVDKVVELGEGIMKAFTDPKQALLDFGNSIKTYLLDNTQKMLDGFGLLGEALSKLWDRDFKGAAESAKKGALKIADGFVHLNPMTAGAVLMIEGLVSVVQEVAPAMQEAWEAGDKLATRNIALRKAQGELRMEIAESSSKLKEYNDIANDATKSIEDRLEATQNATALEKHLMDERIRLATEALSIAEKQATFGEQLEEDKVALQELEITLKNLELERLNVVTEGQTQLNGIREEGILLLAEEQALEQERLEASYNAIDKYNALFQTAQQNEIDAVAKKYDELSLLAYENGLDDLALIEMQEAEANAIIKKYEDQRVADEKAANDEIKANAKALQDSKLQMAGAALGALSALNGAFSKDSEAGAKKQFKRNKALGIASATINTYASIADALAKDATFPGSRFIAAAAAGATGLAQVMKISQTQFGGGDTATVDDIRPPQQGGGIASGPQLDLGFLGQGSGMDMNRAYVVSQEVTTSQQANQLVNDQASLYQ